MIGGGASFFAAPLIGTAIAVYWGWRGSFITLSVLTLTFGILFYSILRKRVAFIDRIERKSVPLVQDSSYNSRRLRQLIIFIFMSTFAAAILFSSMSFIPLFLVDRVGFTKETAGAFYALLHRFAYQEDIFLTGLGQCLL
jgi:predicted MFS family arabinose efflux permease